MQSSGAAGAGLSVLNARKTARDPVLMAEAWVRTHSIGRTGPHRPACEAATSATADAACLGCGNAARTVVRVCIGRLSVVAGTARARCCSPFAAVCWAEVLPVTAADAGRALGPMLPSSARERWPFCVLRDSCHAALPDQPGLPSIGSGRWTGGSRRRPRLIRLATDGHAMDDAGAWPCCVGMSLSNRKSAAQTALFHACPKSSRLEMYVCNCVLSGVMLSAQAGRGAVDMYVRRRNDGRCVRALGVSMSLQNEHSASCSSSWCLEA